MYDDVTKSLRAAYARSAEEREKAVPEAWKLEERERFLSLVQQEGKTALLEIGPGAGKDSLFFQQHGLDVTCIDLSPEMVELCRQKGLRAYERDILHPGFPPSSFDAVYTLNCLLHVPRHDLPAALQAIHDLLRPGGLCYLGLYGGASFEGVWPDDKHDPKRFFSYHTDEAMQAAVRPFFDVLSFKTIEVDRGWEMHFQSLTLRRGQQSDTAENAALTARG